MTTSHGDLARQVAALRARFADLGARALLAAEAVAASEPLPVALLQELRETRPAFTALRDAVLQHARGLITPPTVDRVTTVQSLEPLVAAIAEAEAEQTRRAAWEAARANALSVLDRVLTVVHREERDFGPLADCQAKARDLHAALSGGPTSDLEREAQMLPGRVRPFTELMALIDGWDHLDDERCAFLQDQVNRSFGRPLGLAALRGKLGREDEAPRPRTRDVEVAGPVVGGDPAAPTVPGPLGAGSPGPPTAPAEPNVPGVPGVSLTPAAPASSPFATVPVSAAGTPMVAVPGAQPVVVEIRLTGDRVQIETPEEKREREALLERLAAESAPWWVRAREAFTSIVDRRLSFSDAAREMLRRFPYLLSVPIQRTPEHDGGRCAEGYAILLQRLDKEEPGFVRDALTRLNPQFTRARDATYPLGQELYLYVVAEGRLYKTYPDFLREVLEQVLPDPGLWTQASIVDADEHTTVVRNGERPGSRQESSTTLREPGERFITHSFPLTAGPLTTRVVTVEAGPLKSPTDVEVRLKEGEAASDKAWIVTTPASGIPDAPRRHRLAGTRVDELGGRTGKLVVAVFNSDPNSERRYDLAITLRRKAAAPDDATPKFAPPRSSPFSTRRR